MVDRQKSRDLGELTREASLRDFVAAGVVALLQTLLTPPEQVGFPWQRLPNFRLAMSWPGDQRAAYYRGVADAVSMMKAAVEQASSLGDGEIWTVLNDYVRGQETAAGGAAEETESEGSRHG